MTWVDFTHFAFRGFSVGFAIGLFIWLIRKVSYVFSGYLRPPRLE